MKKVNSTYQELAGNVSRVPLDREPPADLERDDDVGDDEVGDGQVEDHHVDVCPAVIFRA